MSECADIRIGAWEELRPLLFDLFDNRPEQFTRDNPPPAELAEFIRPVSFRACPSCGGSGREPGSDRLCGSCDGAGTVDW